tara:strand:- start:48 stop:623 length:576 start_codon:yes stop_codon:yes gene_type:complete
MRDQVDIIDNFLNKEDFEKIRNKICSKEMEWIFSSHTTSINDSNKLNDFLFSNLIQSSLAFFENVCFNKPTVNEELYFLLAPLIIKLRAKFLIRIKANLTTATDKPIRSDWHIDHEYEGTTAIYYLNTNNGYTVFRDFPQRIPSRENRVLIFPTSLYHAGISQTDTKARYLINFNYLETPKVEVADKESAK